MMPRRSIFRETPEVQQHEQEELSRKFSFCINAYNHSHVRASTPISTRSLQRIKRELASNNPRVQEFKEDYSDYIDHKLSIQHQIQKLQKTVKIERYNAFSARYESELRSRRVAFQTQERAKCDMKRPWTATSSLSPPKSPKPEEKERGVLKDDRQTRGRDGYAAGSSSLSVLSSPERSPVTIPTRLKNEEQPDDVDHHRVGDDDLEEQEGSHSRRKVKGTSTTRANDVQAALDIAAIPREQSQSQVQTQTQTQKRSKPKRVSVMLSTDTNNKSNGGGGGGVGGDKETKTRKGRASFVQKGRERVKDKSGGAQRPGEDPHGRNNSKNKNNANRRRIPFSSARSGREVQGTVVLPRSKEEAPRARRVNSAKTNYRHPITGQLLQRPSSQPSSGLLNTKTVDMNFAFWDFRKTRSAKRSKAPPRFAIISKEAASGKLQLGLGWRPCPPAMFDVSNMSPVHGKIRSWQEEEFGKAGH